MPNKNKKINVVVKLYGTKKCIMYAMSIVPITSKMAILKILYE
jgi:hypothetical protein